jgi:mannose-1-phosphate guanylyltransferase
MNEMWAIVLAGGEGSRLRSLVRLLHEQPIPKQFATLVGEQSLLQSTLERVRAVAPPDRTMVVVSRDQEELARRQLVDSGEIEIVVQPENRGTALGILLPLARLRRRDPDASVAIFPSDHYVPRPTPYVDSVCRSLRSQRITLLGVSPERADPDLGWIVPSGPLSEGMGAVERFVEKPDRAVAETLFDQGALWNSFVIVGPLRDIWALAAVHLPNDTAAFERADDSSLIDRLYQSERQVDFSRAILERATGLRVARVDGSGWTDWGTPERVIQSLAGLPALDLLLNRILEGQRRTGGMISSPLSLRSLGFPRPHGPDLPRSYPPDESPHPLRHSPLRD